jgi:hypothetical protein
MVHAPDVHLGSPAHHPGISASEVLSGVTTRIWLDFKPDVDCAAITGQLALLDPLMLLNLRKLRWACSRCRCSLVRGCQVRRGMSNVSWRGLFEGRHVLHC